MENFFVSKNELRNKYIPLVQEAFKKEKIEDDDFITALQDNINQAEHNDDILPICKGIARTLANNKSYADAIGLYDLCIGYVLSFEEDSRDKDFLYDLYSLMADSLYNTEQYDSAYRYYENALILTEDITYDTEEEKIFLLYRLYYQLSECITNKLGFYEFSFEAFEKALNFLTKARDLLHNFHGENIQDAECVSDLLGEINYEIKSIYEKLFDQNCISVPQAEELLALMEDDVKYDELFKAEGQEFSCFCEHERKLQLLKFLGREDEYEQFRLHLESLNAKRAELDRKKHEKYMKERKFSESFLTIKERGYLLKGDSFDNLRVPGHHSDYDQMNELFGTFKKDWACNMTYAADVNTLSENSKFDYNIFCYEALPCVSVLEDGKIVRETQTHIAFSNWRTYDYSRKVALFSFYFKKDPQAMGGAGENGIVFLGLFNCRVNQDALEFELVDTRLDLP